MEDRIAGKAYVLGDNIDTDVIIPARYLSLSHTNPAQKDELGSHALEGLSDTLPPFIDRQTGKSPYSIIVAGDNFGCGSSRAQAPGALNAAGVKAVVASYYARIFFRNSVNAALLIPLECEDRLSEKMKTGDDVEIILSESKMTNKSQKKEYRLRPLGAVREILEAGDVFEYAKRIMPQ
ncbi:MAG: 3-isopropylmalate dehydratase [Candidatus Omnitrophica bacterium]|nr:3-isopropylmalate dehydratase [Candidatus Omnitrophota bacterium]